MPTGDGRGRGGECDEWASRIVTPAGLVVRDGKVSASALEERPPTSRTMATPLSTLLYSSLSVMMLSSPMLLASPLWVN